MDTEEGDTWRQRDAAGKQTWEQGGRLVKHRSQSWREDRLYAHFTGGSPGQSLIGHERRERAVKTFSSGVSNSWCHSRSQR